MTVLETLVSDHGILGLLIGFLVLGPGYTMIRTRNLRLELAGEAQRLLNQYMIEEMSRADALEQRLNETQRSLEKAQGEIYALNLQLAHANYQLEELGDLHHEIVQLRDRIIDLEGQITQQHQENQQLREKVEAKAARIQELEQDMEKKVDS